MVDNNMYIKTEHNYQLFIIFYVDDIKKIEWQIRGISVYWTTRWILARKRSQHGL